MPWSSRSLSVDGRGQHISTFRFEDKHVELAADVAIVVSAASEALGTFYGRRYTDFVVAGTNTASRLRALIPPIRLALGRPDADPVRR